jgi:hypothetical protein
MASLQEMLGLDDGPELSDFVSKSPADLPTFAPETRCTQADVALLPIVLRFTDIFFLYAFSHSGNGTENKLDFQIFVDGVGEGGRGEDYDVCVLDKVRADILALSPPDHIWHLTPPIITHALPSGDDERSSSSFVPPHLTGSLSFGEALDDEWLVVALLTEASKKDPRLAITVRDDDG